MSIPLLNIFLRGASCVAHLLLLHGAGRVPRLRHTQNVKDIEHRPNRQQAKEYLHLVLHVASLFAVLSGRATNSSMIMKYAQMDILSLV